MDDLGSEIGLNWTEVHQLDYDEAEMHQWFIVAVFQCKSVSTAMKAVQNSGLFELFGP